jgi:hypothetical protein
MPEVHLPHLDDHDESAAEASDAAQAAAAVSASAPRRRSSVWKIAIEVLLISAGVFLGLMGEQWRENVHKRELAEQALHRFRTEVAANRSEVAKKFAYHEPLAKRLREFLGANAEARKKISFQFNGIRPPFFEHTAWDLALATQSLANIDADLAFMLSRLYNYQSLVTQLGNGLTQAMYMAPPSNGTDAFLQATDLYYGDLMAIEPELLKMYDEILPQLDRAIAH